MKKFVLDTNLYVHAFRSKEAARELRRFYASFTPNSYLSSVVLHELLAGANTEAKAKDIDEDIARPLRRTGRIVTPSHTAWERAGRAIAEMGREEKVELRRIPKSLVADFVLAASCREAGLILVTDDTSDFERVCQYLEFRFTEPWPG